MCQYQNEYVLEIHVKKPCAENIVDIVEDFACAKTIGFAYVFLEVSLPGIPAGIPARTGIRE